MRKFLRKFPRLYHAVRLANGFRKALALFARLHPEAGNYFRCFLSALLRKEVSWGQPMLLNIEPTNICDQKCTICETGLGILERKPKMMSFQEFKTILDQFDHHLRIIYFYFMGESFLNKDAYKMIRHAAERGIYVSACTNGNCIDPEQLVQSGIADIQFQIAGITPDIHTKYRVGGDLEKVVKNVKETIALREKPAQELSWVPYPMNIGLGFILLKPNEHQVNDFRKMAEELGVDEANIIDPCVRTVEQGRELLPSDQSHWIYDPKAFASGRIEPRVRPRNYCEWLYTTVTVQVNGDVVPCCRDVHGRWALGNLLKEDLRDVWNGERLRHLRRTISRDQERFGLCELCSGYSLPRLFGVSRKKKRPSL